MASAFLGTVMAWAAMRFLAAFGKAIGLGIVTVITAGLLPVRTEDDALTLAAMVKEPAFFLLAAGFAVSCAGLGYAGWGLAVWFRRRQIKA